MYSYVIRMSLAFTRMSSVCHLHVTPMYSYVLVCHLYVTRMYLYVMVCHSDVLVCHPYVARVYSYVISMSSACHSYVLVCTRMSSVCQLYVLVCTRTLSVRHSYVLVCHSYVTRMWFYHEPKLTGRNKTTSLISLFSC